MRTIVKPFPTEYRDAFDYFKLYCNAGVNLLMESRTPVNVAYSERSIVASHPAIRITGKNEYFSIEALTDTGCAILSAFDNDDFGYAQDLTRKDDVIEGRVEKVINSSVSEDERIKLLNPSQVIRTVLQKFEGIEDDLAGLYGAFAYDFARNFENFGDRFREGGSPDFVLYLPTTIVHFDDRQKKATVKELYFDGKRDIKEVQATEFTQLPKKTYEDMSLSAYALRVADIKREIRRQGRVYQCVLSRNAGVSLQKPPMDSYGQLRDTNPSPYSFFFVLDNGNDGEYLYGASPELHVVVENGEVEIRPIAGTRSRSKNPNPSARAFEDMLARVDLLTDEKEGSEHMMLVDLARNDVHRLCYDDSVRVPPSELKIIEEYTNLYHLVSSVKGRLRNDLDALHALLTTLPAGTLSGAPKVEAMTMIEELETSRRNYYGGAVGYLTFKGNCNTGITIRSVHVKDGMSYMRAGAGIVADSDPEREADEIQLKSEKALEVLG